MAQPRRPKPPSQRFQRVIYDRPTAFHEAGHAVVAELVGLRVDYVTIRRQDHAAGVSDGHTALSEFRREHLIGKGREAAMPCLIQMLAGVLAENLVRPARFEDSGSKDFETASLFAAMAMCETTVEGGMGSISEEERRRHGNAMQAALEGRAGRGGAAGRGVLGRRGGRGRAVAPPGDGDRRRGAGRPRGARGRGEQGGTGHAQPA